MKTKEVKTDFSAITARVVRCIVCEKNLPENSDYEVCLDCASFFANATGDDLEFHEDFICEGQGALSLCSVPEELDFWRGRRGMAGV